MHASDSTHADLTALLQRGISIAIDDFGTGYSNLACLRQIPATSLKIDQSFVRTLARSTQDATLVRTIIEMARELGLRVVVEGVETRAIYDAVLALDCDEAQGYYLAVPLEAHKVASWLAAYRPPGQPMEPCPMPARAADASSWPSSSLR